MSGSKNRQYTLAILFVILDSVGFSLMNFFVKLSGDLPAMQKAFFRNAIALIVSVIVLAGTREKFRIKKESWPWLILRSIFGSLGIFCNFWALSRLTIADASILNKMSPFFAIIMSIFILHELPGVFEWFCVAAAFAGTLFVVKPTAGLASIPAAIGLAGGFFAGTAYTFVRFLGTCNCYVFLGIFVSCISAVAPLPLSSDDSRAGSFSSWCRHKRIAGAVVCNKSLLSRSRKRDIRIRLFTGSIRRDLWILIPWRNSGHVQPDRLCDYYRNRACKVGSQYAHGKIIKTACAILPVPVEYKKSRGSKCDNRCDHSSAGMSVRLTCGRSEVRALLVADSEKP